jgi:WD40 repeat protein
MHRIAIIPFQRLPARKSYYYVKMVVAAGFAIFLLGHPSVVQGDEEADSKEAHVSTIQRIPPLPGMKESPVIAAIALNQSLEQVAVAGDDHSIRLIKQKENQIETVLRGHKGWIQCLEYSLDQNLLVSGGNDGEVWLWQQQLGWKGKPIARTANAITAIAIHPTSELIAIAAFDEQPFLIDRNGKVKARLKNACTDTRCLLFSNDGSLLAAGGRDGQLRLWDVGDKSIPESEPKIEAKMHSRRIHALAFAQDNSMLYSAGEDRVLVQYDLVAKEERSRITLTGMKALSLTLISDQFVAVGGADNTIRIVDLKEKSECSRLAGHQGSVVTLRRSGDDLISGSFDTTIRRWSISQALKTREIDVIPISKKPGTEAPLPTR